MEFKLYKNIKTLVLIIMIFSVSLSFSGCIDGELDVSRLMEKPLEYNMPIGKNVEERFLGTEPTIINDYAGYYVDVHPVYGQSVRISQLPLIPQMIMEAYNNNSTKVNYQFKEKFRNSLTVYNDIHEKVLELELSSDGTIYARKDKKSPVFRFPEYVYYAIEGILWNMGDAAVNKTETCNSLIEPLADWSPSMGPELIELRLEHDVKTMLYIMYGYSDALFITYETYSTLALDRQYKIYMLLAYEGYDFVEDTFWPRYGEVIPVQLIYSWVEGNIWTLTEIKFASYNKYGKMPQENIRKILPFLDTQKALAALEDTTKYEEELERQAMEYLSDIGKGNIKVVDRK
ncbi:MAG: hypothetical protein AB1Z23_06250 [Eubacteriales bacterium]